MISDSIPNASVATGSANPKDFAKKKTRANRWAKLKQCKLDARREQWLSQVKNKGQEIGGGGTLGGLTVHLENEKGQPIEKLVKPRDGDAIYGSINLYSDSESWPSNSPTSHVSSILGSNESGVNFTASSRSGSSNSIRGSSSSSNGFCSEEMSEEDEGHGGDDDCLDDWEAVADALAATDNKKQDDKLQSEYGLPPSGKYGSYSQLKLENQPCSGVDMNSESGGVAVQRAWANFRAWRPDDAFRPQGLPNLSKQYSFPLNSERHLGRGGSVWGCTDVGLIPTSCPICYEDLDCTDSSFLPCLCGFRLCLFCHKRILEQDSRCPGCRKQYDSDPVKGEATLVDGGRSMFRLGRSCSMITRS